MAMESQYGGGGVEDEIGVRMGGGPDTWITPSATEDDKRAAKEFRWNCLTSRSGCRTVCDLYPVGNEYATSGTWQLRREACLPSSSASYWR
jgi:hypothetical protein